MFERIKCYRSLKKHEQQVRGIIVLGLLTDDVSMIREANTTLDKIRFIKKKMWFNRKMAVAYNRACIKYGFSTKVEL